MLNDLNVILQIKVEERAGGSDSDFLLAFLNSLPPGRTTVQGSGLFIANFQEPSSGAKSEVRGVLCPDTDNRS